MADKCKGCGKPIRWIKTVKGKPMPCDPPEVTIISRGGVIFKGFIPHWTTCPEADQFRDKKPTSGVAHLQTQCQRCGEYFTGADCGYCNPPF